MRDCPCPIRAKIPAMMHALIALFLRCLASLRFETAERLGAALGLLSYHLGVRRRVVAGQIKQCLPDLSPAERRRAIRACYCSIGANVFSIFATADDQHPFGDRWRQMNPQWCQLMGQRHPGAVYLTLHLGAWEANAWITIRHLQQERIICYATTQHDALLDQALNQRRTRRGADMVFVRGDDRRSALQTIRSLRGGERSAYLLSDQGPRPRHGQAAWFLGQPTYCHHGAVIFAQRAGVPIIPCVSLRSGPAQFNYFCGRPLDCSALDEDQALQICMDCLSALIAAFPGQYFWHHRRFKHHADIPARDREPWRERGLRVLTDPLTDPLNEGHHVH